MALDSLLTWLKRDVTAVTAIHPNVYAGLRCNRGVTADVSDVTKPIESAAAVTAVTTAQHQTLQPEPAWNKACTAVTAVTCKEINAEVGFIETVQSASNDPSPTITQVHGNLPALETPLIDIGTVRPPGLSAKLLAASMALDAQIHAAGLLPGNESDRWCYPSSEAMNTVELDLFAVRLTRFTTKGVSTTEAESLTAKLVIRDRDSDDRRLCLECRHLAGYGPGSWRCGNWQHAAIAIRVRDAQLPADLVRKLQRCDGFTNAINPSHTTTG